MALQFSHVALVCTVVLIGTTTWLAVEGRYEVRSERNKGQLLESQLAAAQNTAKTGGGALLERVNQLENRLTDLDRDQNVLATETATLKTQTRENTQKIVGKDENGLPPLPPEEKVSLDPTSPAPPAAGAEAVTAVPVAPNPAQERILAAKPLARITGFLPDALLVDIAGGAAQGIYKDAKYQVRRGMYLIGEVTVTDVEGAEAAGAFTAANPNAMPKEGDEVIERLK